MSEPQQPDPEKARKTRSFGSFLLFVFVLIVILAIFHGDPLHKSRELTQDAFLWSLHTGEVVRYEVKGNEHGSNTIEGTYIDPATGSATPFQTRFANGEAYEEPFRQLKALDYERIGAEPFLDALAGGWYEPFEARLLTGLEHRERAEGKAGEAEVPAAAEPAPGRRERLLVGVVARSEGAYNAAFPDRAASFELGETSGTRWLDVDLEDVDDLSLLLAQVEAAGAPIERLTFDLGRSGSTWRSSDSMLGSVFLLFGPWILIFLVFWIFMRQMRGQGGAGGVMSFGRSRAQMYTKENHTNVTFDDVAGMEEAKSEVREIVEFLKNPGRFTRIGGRIPRGVLLNGPPGCGKTLLAKAIAGEAEVPFFSISGSDFVEMFVGVGASRVRDLFKQARDNSPCIIFLDEIDAVGRRRGSGMGGGHDEREQTLNAILVEMDGFSTDKGIIVVAATNRPDVLDPALLRPGRFDREVTIDYPDLDGRRQILGVHIQRVQSSDEVDVDTLARQTPGYSGADLAAIVNEAAIMAVLAKRDEVLMEDLEEALVKVRYGRQKRSAKIEEEDRKITAIHEAGHAVVAAVIDETDPPHKVTIVPRGRALGATMTLPVKESYHMQKRRLLGQLAVLFGGRVAEALFCGDISAGASDDIRRATDLARSMVTELGMSEKIGPINYAERQGSDFLGTELMRGKAHSEETAREIDREVHAILDEAYERATGILEGSRSSLEEVSAALLRFETITGDEVQQMIDGALADDLRPEVEATPEVATPEPTPPSAEERSPEEDMGGEFGGNPAPSPA